LKVSEASSININENKPALADKWLTLHAFSGTFRLLTQLLAMMVLVPIIIHYEGQERYGIWTLSMAIGALLAFLELGLVQATNRFLSSVDYRSRPQELADMACTTFWLNILSGIFVLVVGLPFSEEIARLFEVPEKVRSEAGLVIAIMIWRLALSIPLRNFQTALISQRLMVRAHLAQGVSNLLYFAGGVYALYIGSGIEGLSMVYLVTMIVEHSAYMIMSRRVLPLNVYLPWKFRAGLVKRILEFSMFAWLGQLVSVIYLRAGVLFVQLTCGLVATGAFGLANRLTSISSELATQVIFAGGPKIAKLAASGDEGMREAGYLSLVLARRSVLLSGPLAAIACGLGYPFLVGWVGDEMADMAYLPLVIMAFTIALASPSATAGNALSLMGDHRWTNLATTALVLFYVPLTYMGGEFLGMVGVALSGLVVNVIVGTPPFLYRISRLCGLPLAMWWREVYKAHVLPFGATLFISGLFYLLTVEFVPRGRYWMLASACGGTLLGIMYILTYFRFTAPPNERAVLDKFVSKIFGAERGGK